MKSDRGDISTAITVLYPTRENGWDKVIHLFREYRRELEWNHMSRFLNIKFLFVWLSLSLKLYILTIEKLKIMWHVLNN